MARYALLIGCDQFEDAAFQPLRYPRNDVQRLKAILDDPELGFFDETTPLLNEGHDTVRRSLERFVNKAQKGDLLLFYFSGHGKLDRAGQLALVQATTDSQSLMSTSLGSEELKRYFNNSSAAQKVIILDCCHSGAFGPDGFKGAAADAMVSAMADSRDGGAGNHVLTACTKFELAKERSGIDAGVLTDTIIRGIEGGIPSDGAAGEITLTDIVNYLGKAMPRGDGQTPQYSSSQVSGSVVLAKRKRVFDDDWEFNTRTIIAKLSKANTIDRETAKEISVCLGDPARRAEWALIDQLTTRRLPASQFLRRWITARAVGAREKAPEDSASSKARQGELEAALAAARAEAEGLRTRLAAVREQEAELAGLGEELREARGALRLAQADLATAKATADRIRAERTLAQKSAESLESALASEKSRSERRKLEREDARKTLAAAELELSKAQATVDRLRSERNAAREEAANLKDAQAVAAAEPQTRFTVWLTDVGHAKINVIKEVRQILPHLGLAEAKDLVERAPQPIKADIPQVYALMMKRQLEAVGATVQVI